MYLAGTLLLAVTVAGISIPHPPEHVPVEGDVVPNMISDWDDLNRPGSAKDLPKDVFRIMHAPSSSTAADVEASPTLVERGDGPPLKLTMLPAPPAPEHPPHRVIDDGVGEDIAANIVKTGGPLHMGILPVDITVSQPEPDSGSHGKRGISQLMTPKQESGSMSIGGMTESELFDLVADMVVEVLTITSEDKNGKKTLNKQNNDKRDLAKRGKWTGTLAPPRSVYLKHVVTNYNYFWRNYKNVERDLEKLMKVYVDNGACFHSCNDLARQRHNLTDIPDFKGLPAESKNPTGGKGWNGM